VLDLPVYGRNSSTSQPFVEHLTTIRRQEIAERIHRAVSSDRNIVESGDYQDAREEQALLERRIAILQERIVDAEVVDPDAENGVLDVGERVRLRDLENDEEIQYELVGSLEADPFAGRIWATSPLGRALLGRRGGEVATVDAPRGRLRFKDSGDPGGLQRRRTVKTATPTRAPTPGSALPYEWAAAEAEIGGRPDHDGHRLRPR